MCTLHLHSEKDEKANLREEKTNPLFLWRLVLSSLIEAGRLLTEDLPQHNPFYLFFFPCPYSIWFLVHGSPQQKRKFRYVCVRCVDSKHMCYISPRSWESHPRFCFVCLILSVIEKERGNMRSPSFCVSFVFHSLTVGHWRLSLIDIMPILAIVFFKIIPLFDSTYRILFDNIISSLNWIGKWQGKTSSDNY